MKDEERGSMLTVSFRLAAVAGIIFVWFFTQRLIGQRSCPEGQIGDKVHEWLEPVNRFLHRRAAAARALLIASSVGVDFLGLLVFYVGIFGPSFRPVIGLTVLMTLRQMSQYLNALPSPPGMIWHNPGVPSLFVTYGVTNDLFFSGHTALAVYGGLTLAFWGGPGAALLGLGLAVFEIVAVLALRAHWTMDVYAGFVTALLCFFAIT